MKHGGKQPQWQEQQQMFAANTTTVRASCGLNCAPYYTLDLNSTESMKHLWWFHTAVLHTMCDFSPRCSTGATYIRVDSPIQQT